MTYKYRSGIIRTSICGEYFLIPTREASEECPEIIQLPLFSAAVLEEIEKGRDLSVISGAFQKLTRKPASEIDSKIKTILDNLCEKGYLIQEKDGE